MEPHAPVRGARPINPSNMWVARTEGCTYAAKVWAVKGRSVIRAKLESSRFAHKQIVQCPSCAALQF
jgi:hypothetical protein